jgi:hypothetical protein
MKMKTLFQIIILSIGIFLQAQCFDEVAVSGEHVLVIKNDGTLWGWGSNISGTLGLNSTTSQYHTPQLISNDTDWVKVVNGGSTSWAIKSDGTLWSCGDGQFGALGFGDQNNVYVLTQVGNDNDWFNVSSASHTITTKSDGTLWGWGSNVYGQLNINTNSIELNPIQISTDADWKQVVCINQQTLAIKTDGTLWACGYNSYGQLGDGTTTNRLIFVQIGTDTDWDFVTGYDNHSIALKTDGTIWGWGSNENNVLGLPSSISQVNTPIQINAGNDWADVSSGFFISTAIKTDGTLWENDENGFYQVGTDTDWEFVKSGFNFSFMLKTNGTLWGIGGNNKGQLGIGNGVNEVSMPIQLNCSSLGIEEITNKNKFSLYPNHTNGMLFIKNNSYDQIDKIKIADLSGKIIYETNNVSEIDLSNFQTGIYILIVTSSNEISKFKVVRK